MEYKKDKRTNNLTLREIHVGDWVQVWSEQAERYSPPLKIISIHDDGTIYLVTSDEERPTPWEENIKNVDALVVTEELLRGFGLVFKSSGNMVELYYCGNFICKIGLPIFMHELCDYFAKYAPFINLEWKGIEK